MSLNVLASPLQSVRDVFDLMPQDTEDDWRVFADPHGQDPRGPRGLPGVAPAGAREAAGLRRAARSRPAPSSRVTSPPTTATSPRSSTTRPSATHRWTVRCATPSPPRRGRRRRHTAAFADWLERELLPHAPEADAAGGSATPCESRYFLGAAVDLEETYALGPAGGRRACTARWPRSPRASSPARTVERRRRDPRRRREVPAARHRRAQGVDAGAGRRGDRRPRRTSTSTSPEPVQRIECMIAPTQTGGIYYTGPSEDFSRPGRMWWSVPQGRHRVPHVERATTVYHEGVPGHHLQVGQTRLPLRAAQQVAAPRGVDVGPRRGLGPLCRAADGRARLHGRPGQPDGHA